MKVHKHMCIYPEAISEIRTVNVFTTPKDFLSGFLSNKSESSVLWFQRGVEKVSVF